MKKYYQLIDSDDEINIWVSENGVERCLYSDDKVYYQEYCEWKNWGNASCEAFAREDPKRWKVITEEEAFLYCV